MSLRELSRCYSITDLCVEIRIEIRIEVVGGTPNGKVNKGRTVVWHGSLSLLSKQEGRCVLRLNRRHI